MKSNRSPTRFHHSVSPGVKTAELAYDTLNGWADGAMYDGDTDGDGDGLATPEKSTTVADMAGSGLPLYVFPVPYAHTTCDTPVNEI